MQEICGAIERIDDPGEACFIRLCHSALFGDECRARHDVTQSAHQFFFCLNICFRHQLVQPFITDGQGFQLSLFSQEPVAALPHNFQRRCKLLRVHVAKLGPLGG